MAEEPQLGATPMPDLNATAKLEGKVDNSNKLLSGIAEKANQTDQKMKDLVSQEKKNGEEIKKAANTLKDIADQNKKATQQAAEDARENKEESKSSAVDMVNKLVKNQQATTQSMAAIYKNSLPAIITGGFGNALKATLKTSGGNMLGTALAGSSGLLVGFITTAIPMYMKLFQSFGRVFDLGLIHLRRVFGDWIPRANNIGSALSNLGVKLGTSFTKLAGEMIPGAKYIASAFSYIGTTFIKLAKGVSTIVDLGLIRLRGVFGTVVPRLRDIMQFFGRMSTSIGEFGSKIGKIFSADSMIYGTLGFIEKFFGPKTGMIFAKAFDLGSKIASKIPLLSLIPTIIESVISAFSKFKTEGFRGVFKSLMVGLLKGLAAFFTFGLSDLALDFNKMYAKFSESFDGIFDQVEGFVKLFTNIFMWLIGMAMKLWEDVLKPIFVSLWEDALKPIMEALGAVGNFAMVLANVILGALKPVLAITRFVFTLIFGIVKVLWEFVLMPIITLLVPLFKVLFKVIGYLFKPVVVLFEILSFLVTSIYEKALKPIFNFITDFFNAGSDMVSLGQGLKDAAEYWGQMFSDIVDFFGRWYDSVIGELGRFFYWLWTTVEELVGSVMSWWTEVEAGFSYFMEGVDYVLGKIGEFFAMMYNLVLDATDYVMNLIENAWDALKNALFMAMLMVVEVFHTIKRVMFEKGKQLLLDVFDAVLRIVLTVVNIIQTVRAAIRKAIWMGIQIAISLFVTLGEVLANTGRAIFHGILKAIDKAVNFVIGYITFWKDFFTNLFTMLYITIVSAINGAISIVTGIFDWVKQKGMDALNLISDIWNGMWNGVTSSIITFQEIVIDSWNYLGSLWDSAIEYVINEVSSFFEPMFEFFDFVSEKFLAAKEFVDGLFSWIPGMGGDSTEAQTPKAEEVKEAAAKQLPTADEAISSELDRLNARIEDAERRYQEVVSTRGKDSKGADVWGNNVRSRTLEKEMFLKSLENKSPVDAARDAKLQFRGMEASPEIVAKDAYSPTMTSGNSAVDQRRRERREEAEKWARIKQRDIETYGKENLARMNAETLRGMAAGGGAAGGAGISARQGPVIINNAATTTVGGGGGSSAIPVPLSPTPVHHADPKED